MEISPHSAYREIILSNCQDLLPEWKDNKRRADRAKDKEGRILDRDLAARHKESYDKMDRYLQQLFALHVIAEMPDGSTVPSV